MMFFSCTSPSIYSEKNKHIHNMSAATYILYQFMEVSLRITHHFFQHNLKMWNINSTSRTSQAFGAARPATGNGISSSGCAVCWTTEARLHGCFFLVFGGRKMVVFFEKRNFLKGKLILSQLFTHIYIYVYICLIYIHVISYIYHHIFEIIYTYPVHSCTWCKLPISKLLRTHCWSASSREAATDPKPWGVYYEFMLNM